MREPIYTEAALAKKLYLHKSPRRLLVVPSEVAERPELLGLDERDFIYDALQSPFDLVFIYVFSLSAIREKINWIVTGELLLPRGQLYLAYPKKNNGVFENYVGRDDIFPYLQVPEETGLVPDTDLVFNRMVSLNDVFTVVGLRRTSEEELKKSLARRAQSPQGVEDYASRMADLELALARDAEALARYQSLAPGYRRSWARYVYSAKREVTRQKRLNEMMELLKEGYVSKDQATRKEK